MLPVRDVDGNHNGPEQSTGRRTHSVIAPSPGRVIAVTAVPLSPEEGTEVFLGRHGLPAAHPLDVTDQACHDRQCQQSVITDTVQVTSFTTAAAAHTYARQHGFRAAADIVVTFSPVAQSH